MIYITMPKDHGKSVIRRVKEALEKEQEGFLVPAWLVNRLTLQIEHDKMCHGYKPFERWPTAPCEHELHREWE